MLSMFHNENSAKGFIRWFPFQYKNTKYFNTSNSTRTSLLQNFHDRSEAQIDHTVFKLVIDMSISFHCYMSFNN